MTTSDLNKLQLRLVTVLTNIGGTGTVRKIKERGGIPKPLDILTMNLRQLERSGVVTNQGNSWVLNKPKESAKQVRTTSQPSKRKPTGQTRNLVRQIRSENPDMSIVDIGKRIGVSDVTVHHHLRKIREEDEELNRQSNKVDEKMENVGSTCVVLDAVERLRDKLATNDTPTVKSIKDFQLKYDTLTALSEVLEDSISELCLSMREDLTYLNSFNIEPAPGLPE